MNFFLCDPLCTVCPAGDIWDVGGVDTARLSVDL